MSNLIVILITLAAIYIPFIVLMSFVGCIEEEDTE